MSRPGGINKIKLTQHECETSGPQKVLAAVKRLLKWLNIKKYKISNKLCDAKHLISVLESGLLL